MVIYAIQNYLIQYLPTGLDAEQIIVGGWEPNDKQTALHLRDMGGSTEGYPSNRSDAMIQVVARSKDDYQASQLARWAFDTIREIFMMDLYLETGRTIKVSKIGAIQRPSSMGTSQNGLYQYTFTYSVIFSENSQEVILT
jgi:hypothetical protein